MSNLTTKPVSGIGNSISFTPHNDALQNVGSLTAYLLQECLNHPDGLTKDGLEGFAIVLGDMTEQIVTLSDESDKLQQAMTRLSRRLWSVRKEGVRHGNV